MILLIKVGLFLIKLFIKKIEFIIVKFVININVGIIIVNKLFMIKLWVVNFLFIFVKCDNWFFFWINDLMIWMFNKFFFVILLILLIKFWIIMKCLFICEKDSIEIKIIVMISVIIIYYSCGKVSIVKIKFLINKKGILKSVCNVIIMIFWIWVMLFVKWIIKLFVENFLILLNEKVWILWKVVLWMLVLIFWVILVEKIVLIIFVMSFNFVMVINWIFKFFILLLLLFIIVFNICCNNFGC